MNSISLAGRRNRINIRAKILSRLGTLYTKDDDETQAFHNFQDSFQVYPVNMEVISWLGVWYVKSGLYEEAIQYFDRAAEIEPYEIKWQLMVTSCYRRMNDYKQALQLYKKTACRSVAHMPSTSSANDVIHARDQFICSCSPSTLRIYTRFVCGTACSYLTLTSRALQR